MNPTSGVIASLNLTIRSLAIGMALLLALALSISSLPVASAQSERSINDGMTLIAFDLTLRDLRDIEAAEVAASLVLSRVQTGVIAIGEYSDSPREPRTYSSIDAAQTQIRALAQQLRESADSAPAASGLSAMLARYGTYMEQLNTPAGSKLVMLTAGKFDDPANTTPDNMSVFAQHFISIGANVDVISLVTTPTADREVISRVARETNGTYHDIGFNQGIVEMLSDVMEIAFQTVESINSNEDEMLSHRVEVPPHSKRLVTGLVFDNPSRDVVLVSPGGQELIESAPNLQIVSYSRATLFSVADPEPGTWWVTSTGGTSEMIFVSLADNPIDLIIPETPPFPLAEEILLKIDARVGQQPHIDTQAFIEASMTLLGEEPEVFILNDKGEDGDQTAEDGTFSAIIPPQEVPGIRNVLFSMRWPAIEAAINTEGTISIDPFPTANLTINPQIGMITGNPKRVLIGDLELDVSGYPYLALPDELSVKITNQDTGAEFNSTVEPRAMQDGKAFQFRVLAELQDTATYEIALSIDTNYLGRDYLLQVAPLSVLIQFQDQPSRANLILLAVLGVFVILISAGVVFVVLRPRPYGYIYKIDIYGDRELVVDMASFRFAPLERIISSNSIPAAALSAIPIRGGRFVFSRKERVQFLYHPETDGDLRMTLDGAPLRQGYTDIRDGSEIGIMGERFVFLQHRMPGDVPLSSRIKEQEEQRLKQLARFTSDPMTFDGPAASRPTRRE